MSVGGVEYQLVQMKADDALWLLRPGTEAGLGNIAGILVVYVDDLAVFAEVELARSCIAAVQALWKTSEPEWLGEAPVTFCGLENHAYYIWLSVGSGGVHPGAVATLRCSGRCLYPVG